MTQIRGLTEAIASMGPYPTDHPQTVADLVAADPDKLTHPLAWLLRKQAIEAMRASERHTINGPKDLLRLLTNGYAIHPWEGAWVSYALTAERHVAMTVADDGALRSVRKATKLLPKHDDLPALPRSYGTGARKPAWLVVYGGSPDVLSKPHVAKGIATLQRRTEVADVVFYDTSGTAPRMWSLCAGVGIDTASGLNGAALPFPDEAALEEARTA